MAEPFRATPPTPEAHGLGAFRDSSGGTSRQLARLVANDLDPAYRRRQRVLLGWLLARPARPLVDLGCGRGFSLNLLRALGHEAYGLDVDVQRLLTAQAAGASRLVRAGATRLPLASDAFGGVLASELLEHVGDDLALLREIRRALRPGGVVALSVPHADYPWSYDPPNAFLARLGRGPIRSGPLAGIWTDHRRLYQLRDLVARVEAAGLRVCETRLLTGRSAPFLHHAIYALGPRLLSVLPAEVRSGLDRSRPGAAPARIARGLRRAIDVFDRRNHEEGEAPGSRSVNLAILARRP